MIGEDAVYPRASYRGRRSRLRQREPLEGHAAGTHTVSSQEASREAGGALEELWAGIHEVDALGRGPGGLGQVVGGREAYDAAAEDHGAGAGAHGGLRGNKGITSGTRRSIGGHRLIDGSRAAAWAPQPVEGRDNAVMVHRACRQKLVMARTRKNVIRVFPGVWRRQLRGRHAKRGA